MPSRTNLFCFASLFLLLSLHTDRSATQTSQDVTRDPASNQLRNYKGTQSVPLEVTTSYGTPVDDKANSVTAGRLGPVVLQDNILLDELQHFNRERIPERSVHAKGAGAFGYFEVTNDITQYSKASVFSKIGKKTPIVMRFSTVGGETGSADTVRDPRGFSIKYYTDDGIWDLVGNNTPIFFIRDALLFASFIHTQKRNPVTHLKDRDMFWDFLTLRPESTHQVMFMFSDRGIPDGHRHMNGYGSNTFKLVNANGQAVYCKFHHKTNQGIKNLPVDKAAELASSDPDYSIRDLYNAISTGNFPSWNTSIQVMTYEQAEKFRWNPFDVTKIWPQAEFPLIPVGRIVLDRNPRNYFTDVEQSSFNPAHMVPGIEPSPDKMLQGRLFAYSDAHMYRLGVNGNQLPVNSPFRSIISNTHRDGQSCYGDNQNGAPNYFPNSFSQQFTSPRAVVSPFTTVGDVARYNTSDDDNFSQPALFWNLVLKPDEKQRLVDNLVNHLKDASVEIQAKASKNFHQVDEKFGDMFDAGLQAANL